MSDLTRNKLKGKVGGVCSGLADCTEVDATIFRLIFVLLTLGGGCGILLYCIMWAIMPENQTK